MAQLTLSLSDSDWSRSDIAVWMIQKTLLGRLLAAVTFRSYFQITDQLRYSKPISSGFVRKWEIASTRIEH